MTNEYDGDPEFEIGGEVPETPNFGSWLKAEMAAKGLKIRDLEERTGITYTGIRNIVEGNTVSPRHETRTRLAQALNETVPPQIEAEIASEAALLPGYEWAEFTPSDLETVPNRPGVYVFYDVTDRPVYVGKSVKDIRGRVKDHQTRFWFKPPLVVKGAFLEINDDDLCNKIEMVLIRFLGKHALLNVKGAVRDPEE